MRQKKRRENNENNEIFTLLLRLVQVGLAVAVTAGALLVPPVLVVGSRGRLDGAHVRHARVQDARRQELLVRRRRRVVVRPEAVVLALALAAHRVVRQHCVDGWANGWCIRSETESRAEKKAKR